MLIRIMWEFFKTGLLAIGGGLATIPFLKDMSLTYNWFSLDMLQVMINVAESTPGPIGINMATYVGYNLLGVMGGIVTTISLVTPSIIIILIISKILEKFKSSKLVDSIFKAIRPASLGMIIYAVSDIFLKTLFNTETLINFKQFILYVVMFIITLKFKKIHPILIIVMCAIMGIILGI